MKIAINGRALSGKGQIAKYLVSAYGFKEDSFAKPIYDICRDYLSMKEKNRDYLIGVGQAFRELKQDVWIDLLLERIKDCDGSVVVSDVRQANEFVRLKEDGFIMIRVKSSLENRIKRCKERDGFEPSEKDISQWESCGEIGGDDFIYDYEIENNGTQKELFEKVDEIVRERR